MPNIVQRISDRGRAIEMLRSVETTRSSYSAEEMRELTKSVRSGGLGISTPYRTEEIVRVRLEEGLEGTIGNMIRYAVNDVLPIVAIAPRKLNSALAAIIPKGAYFLRGFASLVTGEQVEAVIGSEDRSSDTNPANRT